MCARCHELQERCENLENLLHESEEANAELGLQLAGVQVQARRAGASERRWRQELDGYLLDKDPLRADVATVLEAWRTQLGHDNATCPINGRRAGAVRKALKYYVKGSRQERLDAILEAVAGLALMPYVVNDSTGRSRRYPVGDEKDRHDELEIALRDERQIERFREYAQRSKRDADHDVAWVWNIWRKVCALNRTWSTLVLDAAVRRETGVDESHDQLRMMT